MFKQRILLVLTLIFIVSLSNNVGFAQHRIPLHRYSAMRMKGEPARSAYSRYLSRLSPMERRFIQDDGQDTALGAARRLNLLDPTILPDFGHDTQGVKRVFEKIRDMRFLQDPEMQGFLRRSSWMYPDDGCFARAALMTQNMAGSGSATPAKVFIFGDLVVKTRNSPEGQVGWWYHVVPGFRMGQAVVVFDPAIDPSKPLLLHEWVKTMTDKPDSVTISFCDPETYVPSDPCHNAPKSNRDALGTQLTFLTLERSRLETLNRDTARELGDFPPWRNPGLF